MAEATTSTNVPLLKRFYGTKVENKTYEKSEFIKNCKKDKNFGGEGRHTPIISIAPTAGGSADFAASIASEAATRNVRFFVTRRKQYHSFSISNELIEAGKKDRGGVIDNLKHEMDRSLDAWGEKAARYAMGNGGGAIGRLDSGVNLASTTVTLRTRTDIVGVYNVGQQLELAQDDGTGTSPLGIKSGQLTITGGINRDTAQFTVNANINSIVSASVNDYVFGRGDYGVAMTGLLGWVPIATPTSGDSFFGVDRTLDVTRLAGFRVASGGTKEETLQDAGTACQIHGARPKHLYTNPVNAGELIKELGSKVVLPPARGETGVSGNVKVHLPTGTVEIISDAYFPLGYFALGDTSTVTLATAGDFPIMVTEGAGTLGLQLLENSDSRRGRYAAYGNYIFDDPGSWCLGTW